MKWRESWFGSAFSAERGYRGRLRGWRFEVQPYGKLGRYYFMAYKGDAVVNSLHRWDPFDSAEGTQAAAESFAHTEATRQDQEGRS